MNDKANTEGFKGKIHPTSTAATFSVTKGMLFPYSEKVKSIPKKTKGSPDRQTLPDILKGIADLDPETIGKIEQKLRLTFVPETGEAGNVCLADSPEVRDEYKDIFDAKELLDYIYAVLHSPEYLLQYKDLSKIDVVEVRYPDGQYRFWKLASLGAQLRQLHLSESATEKEYSNQTDKILKKLAEIEYR